MPNDHQSLDHSPDRAYERSGAESFGPVFGERLVARSLLTSREQTQVWSVDDRLTGLSCIAKCAPRTAAIREVLALLAVGPNIGPRLIDLCWTGERAVLLLERLPGESLATIASRTTDDANFRAWTLVLEIMRVMSHMHRLDLVHTDMKPSHIYIDGTADAPRVRFIDFGSAESVVEPLGLDAATRECTPPFAAPELHRDWAVDHRADQYALGVSLATLFPDEVGGSEPIERMMEKSPARRYRDLDEAMEAIRPLVPAMQAPQHPTSRGFGLLLPEARRNVVDEIETHSARSTPVLLIGRTGTGLSHALHRAAIEALLEEQEQPFATFDVAAMSGADLGRVLGAAASSAGCRVLAAVNGWSTSEPHAIRLSAARRIYCAPLEPFDIVDLLLAGRGAADEDTLDLCETIAEACDGNLRVAAKMSAAAREKATDLYALRVHVQREVDEELQPLELPDAAALLARLGPSFGREQANALLERFGDVAEIDRMVNLGALSVEKETVHFASLGMHRRFVTNDDDIIDAWIHDCIPPRFDRPSEVLYWCRRSERLGDAPRAAEWLDRSLLVSLDRSTRRQSLELLCHPKPVPRHWTIDVVTHLVEEHPLQAHGWSSERLVHAFAVSLIADEMGVALDLFESLDGTEYETEASRWRLWLLAALGRREEADALLDVLERSTEAESYRASGVLELTRGLLAFDRDRDDAQHLCESALVKLRRTGSRYESECLGALGALAARRSDLEEARSIFEEITTTARNAPVRSQALLNLAQVHRRLGDLEGARLCSEEGIRLEGKRWTVRGARHLDSLARTHLDANEISRAHRSAESLLRRATVRNQPRLVARALCLLSEARLHAGAIHGAVANARSAIDVADRLPGARLLQNKARRELLSAAVDTEEPVDLTTMAPPHATEGAGAWLHAIWSAAIDAPLDLRGAVDRLESFRSKQDGQGARYPERGIYYYTLARMYLDLAVLTSVESDLESARRCLHEAIELYSSAGRTFEHTRCRVLLAVVHRLAGENERALALIDECMHVAHSSGFKGILAASLRERARVSVG